MKRLAAEGGEAMLDILLFALFALACVFYLWAWLRILHKAFAAHWRWGWAVLLFNVPLNIPALAYLYIAHQRHQGRYILGLFAPYLALAVLLLRLIDWPQLLSG